MTVKCPVCGRVKNEAKGFKEPIDHTASYHMLISKIHEIIAECEGPHDDSVHLKLTNKDINNIIIENLKSLLEDKN